ncbi:sensor histidine kinase [Deinococcus sp.]|uniref:sensor histidine kinase n=1 Tax=Deinococcus sp. TaxID=47478 RepID=UPI0025C5CE60|nr:sensor histidine kinase [Deinococcus sp.]
MMGAMGLREELQAVRREGPFSDLLEARTYLTTLYIFLSLPAGTAIWVLLLGGVVVSLLTLPLMVGAPLLLGVLWLVGALAEVQRTLAGLLGLEFLRPALPPVYAGVTPWLRATLSHPATYRALLFHLIQLPLALVCWVVLLALGSVIVAGLGSPLWLMNPAIFQVAWRESTLQPSQLAVLGLLLLGAGALLLAGGVVNLIGRVWVRLCTALLARDLGGEAARREVVALRRAAGRVALGDDLEATLTDLARQAQQASTARSIALIAADGSVRASSSAQATALAGVLDALPAPGEASIRATPAGDVLAVLPVALPASAGLQGETLRADYEPGVRPTPDELAFLLSIADHAGTALHAAQLIERASARAGELERARLARELHDSVAQALYGISLGAKTAKATLDRDPARTHTSLDYTIKLAEGGVAEMKALLFSLRPDALEEGGLVAALTQQAHALETRHSLSVHTDLSAEPALPPKVKADLYKIAQEALHNVVKHARASEVWLELRATPGATVLTVRDNGRGFDPASQTRGTLGQRTMRERAAAIGGELEVSSGPAGTTVLLNLPAAPTPPTMSAVERL